MTKQQLRETLKKYAKGDFITQSQIAEALSYKCVKSVTKYTEGLMRVQGTRYYIGDVVERIMDDYK